MLKTGFFTELWDTILQQMNATGKLVQSSTLDINTTAFLLHSWKDFIESLRTEFSQFVKHDKMYIK